MTPQPNQLWALQGQIFELLEAREEALSVLDTARSWRGDFISSPVPQAEAELAAIETAIGDFVHTKVAEVSEVRASYFALMDAAAVAKAEARRAEGRAMVLENRAAKLKELIQSCMETLGRNRFDSAMGYLSIKGNGGKQPVEITNEALIPDEYKRVTITLNAEFANRLMVSMALEEWKDETHFETLLEAFEKGKREISKTAISEALAQDCEHCDGNGVVEPWGELDEDADYRAGENPCKVCGGGGKRGVPGARLAERGKSLVIK